MVDLEHVVSEPEPALALAFQIVEIVRREGEMVRARLETEVGADVRLELAIARRAGEVPERDQLIARGAGLVEDVARDAALLRHHLDLGELEAHRLGVEAVRRLDVLHDECEMVDTHTALLSFGADSTRTRADQERRME